ncbi:MAG: alpha/beta fold hydrolase [Candidatus Heimdallarchaeota archaeon]|nr:alpha/beta fold hydrolase [Candidatus Heimdallarchaeota archaeon]
MNLLESKFFDTKYGKMYYCMPISVDNRPIVLFLHGASKKSQNTEFWKPLNNYIQKHVNPIYVDRMGYGKSKINGIAKLRTADHYAYLTDFLHHIDKSYNNPIAMIGRSQGGNFAAKLLSSNVDIITSAGLIAPAGGENTVNYLKMWNKPISVLWSTRDPVIPFERVLEFFEIGIEVNVYSIGYFDRAAESTENTKKTHVPEIDSPELFESFLINICSRI